MMPSHLVAGAALLGVLLCCSCQSTPTDLENEPWRLTRQGSLGVNGILGIGSDYEVDSTVQVVDANYGGESKIHGVLDGTFGAGLGAEYFIFDDFSLFAGAEMRTFEPDIGEELITFGDITTYEYSLGTRWFLPVRFLENGRLRPFLQGKFAYIPSVEFDMTVRLPFDDPLQDAVMVAPYSGTSYWTWGVGGGLAYQVTDNLLIDLSVYYERSMNRSSGRSTSTLAQSTGNDFVDNIFNGLQYDTTMRPEGWIGFLRLSYLF
jgi:hypothetical protein